VTRRWAARVAAGGGVVLLVVAGTATPVQADAIRDRQWYLPALRVAKAHQITRGAGVTVALIDTGVNAHHRDLAGAVLPGVDLLAYSEGDGTGRDDPAGHGTAMAGIIAGRGHGTSGGVLGMAPAAKILTIRALATGFSDSIVFTKAIDYAIAHHASVINMSFSAGGDSYLQAAIRRAQAADVVLVASAGNNNAPGDRYPGLYPEVLTVGAVGKDETIDPVSVTGSQVDLVAPGADIMSTATDGGYHANTGTSDATAVVSGAAALIRAEYPDLNAVDVVHRLTTTATDAGAPGRDDTYGYGRLNLIAALTTQIPATTTSATTAQTTPTRAAGTASNPRRTPTTTAAIAVVVLLIVVIGAATTVIVVARRRRYGQ
jgi:type VII secretion-associated serine protease mycosin